MHPGPTLGFRVEEDDKAFTYIPDHEPALGPKGFITDPNWMSGSDLVQNTDLLIHDAQFTSDEYQEKIGWGHSSMEDTLAYASLLNVKRLLLFHHDPQRSDMELDRLYNQLKKTTDVNFPFAMAVEGSHIVL